MTKSLNTFCKEFQKNNHKLYNQLFMDYYTNLCRFAYTYVKDTEIAEEIVQELFISLWENRNELNINTSARAYLYTSVRNRSLNYIRNEKTRIGHENEFALKQIEKVTDIIDFCEREELQNIINEAVDELPESCQQIFRLSRYENLSYNEIAQQLNISPKTVENQIGIALKKIRTKLSPYLSCLIMLL